MESTSYYKRAYFIYDKESHGLVNFVIENKFATAITAISIEDFVKDVEKFTADLDHAVVSLSRESITEFLAIAYKYDFSIGILPLLSQKEQIKNLLLSSNMETNLEIALRDDAKRIDLVRLDDKLVYSQAIIGDIIFVSEKMRKVNHSPLTNFIYALKKFFTLKLQKFDITTKNGQHISTAGSAIVVLNHTTKGFLSKVFNLEQSMRDGKITLVIISPASLIDYVQLFSSLLFVSKSTKMLPESIGYLQSESFLIGASSSKKVRFDNGEKAPLPAEFTIIPEALAINASEKFWELNQKQSSQKETIKIANLPDKSETEKYVEKRIPFFRFASEERFKDLFLVLRQDAKLNKIYIVLMLLSTFLAAFGLFADSTAVIIGAMLVAPLMTPIVSLAMGLLRAEQGMIKDSVWKIFVGVFLALLASSLLAYLLPYSQTTLEMNARVNPTLLDLGIAILSGIAAAYTKSFKEISQNLAGVAIAVALVPPLAVAGIGLGYSDFNMFFGAFLLFFTNLVGIVLAAVLTFEVLGFSNVVKSKKGFAFVIILLVIVSFPLYFSYDHMIERYRVAKMLKEHRFIVNNKYIIVKDAEVFFRRETQVIDLKLSVRESLDRKDLEDLREDIQRLFDKKLFITTELEYIL